MAKNGTRITLLLSANLDLSSGTFFQIIGQSIFLGNYSSLHLMIMIFLEMKMHGYIKRSFGDMQVLDFGPTAEEK